MHWAKNALFCEADTMNTGTYKRDPFLNLLPLFWGKKHKRNTWNKASDLSTFSRKAST